MEMELVVIGEYFHLVSQLCNVGCNYHNTEANDIIYVQPNPNYAREILSDITPVLGLISTATSLWATYLIIANQ